MHVTWWKEAVIYEVLVPSFQDSNGDGIGDLPGIVRRLDYLSWLGIDTLWLSPICQTTMIDIGYDVVDYRQVDQRFGSLHDFETLLALAHRRNLRVIVDFVPNHTSHQHAWFLSAKAGRDSPFRDFYIWSDPAADGGPPNNWINRFGLSAWTFEEATGQFYLGTFSPEQPDLNWRSAAVQNEMMDALRFWLDLGTDGVRVDALAHLIKDRGLRNNPRNATYSREEEPSNHLVPFYSQNQPELLNTIAIIQQTVAEYQDRLFLGEVFQTPEQIAIYQRAGADLLLCTSLVQSKFDPIELQMNIDHLEAIMGDDAWPARASGDHDLKRVASKVAPEYLRMAAMLYFTVRGTPTMYYGEELGLKDSDVPADVMVDPSGRQNPRYGRDIHRLPMPWDGTDQAGFTTGQPWLPFDRDTLAKNVQAQRSDPHSLLSFYQRLLQLRRSEPLLRTGDYKPLAPPENMLAFERLPTTAGDTDKLLVVFNFNSRDVTWPVSHRSARILLSTDETPAPGSVVDRLVLKAHEGVIARLEPEE